MIAPANRSLTLVDEFHVVFVNLNTEIYVNTAKVQE